MKIVCLNTWSGVGGLSELLHFFKIHKEADIFCLQEIWNGGEHMRGKTMEGFTYENFVANLYEEIGGVLDGHQGYFHPHQADWFGLALFIKKDISIIEEGEVFVFKNKEASFDDTVANHAKNLQYISIETSAGPRTILNFHGLWSGQGKGKSDTPERLIQSENIVQFLKKISNPYILCGDFNLLPETASLKMIEDIGMRNLITEFGVTSTRSSLYKKPLRFADYVLVSDGIKVNDFKVLPDEVSDHLALYLDCE
jgi:exonuclease III